MAVSQKIAAGTANATDERPVDLVHLGRQTGGNSELEREVLALFEVQSRACLALYASTVGEKDRKRAIHSLKGTARSIGAFRLGDIAARIEAGEISAVEEAKRELQRVIDFIGSLD